MTNEERLKWLKEIEEDIFVCSLESTFAEDAKSCAIHSAIEELEKQKTGHWVDWNETVERFDFTFGSWSEDVLHCKCSECGEEVLPEETTVFKYCPFCGVKIEGE